MSETIRIAELPERIYPADTHRLGLRAARWLAEREDPRRMRDSGNVIFTPHTEEEQAAWRARTAGRRSGSGEREQFRLESMTAANARRALQRRNNKLRKGE